MALRGLLSQKGARGSQQGLLLICTEHPPRQARACMYIYVHLHTIEEQTSFVAKRHLNELLRGAVVHIKCDSTSSVSRTTL